MKSITEIKQILDSNSVNEITTEYIELTYDLGDSQDAERFESKFDKITENYKMLDIQLDILCDECFNDPECEEEVEWNIANVVIQLTEDTDITIIKKMLDEVDYI